MKYIIAVTLWANPAWAACLADEQTFMSCQIENGLKTVEVCFDNANAYYRFGVEGQVPELALQSTLAELDYRPWNGTGQAIWEEVSFQNANYTYAVHGGFDRPWGDDVYEDIPHRNFGAVSVARDGQIFLDLDCDRASVVFTWDDLLWKAKVSLGFVWDDRALEWVALPD